MKRKLLLSLAMMVGFLSFSLTSFAQSWTAEKDGLYVLYNQSADKFVVRAGSWGTQAVLRDYAVPMLVNTTGDGTTFTFRDLQKNLFADNTNIGTWFYCDNTKNNLFTIVDVEGEEGVYYIKSIAANSYLANDGGNLVTTENATDKWCLLKGDDVKAIYAARQLAMIKNVVKAAGADETQLKSEDGIETLMGANWDDVTEMAGFPTGRGEAYQPTIQNPGYKDLKTINLKAPAKGLYKIQIPAMYRISGADKAVEAANAGVDYANVYLMNGEYSIPVATATSDATADDKGDSSTGEINGATVYFPNGQDGFANWSKEGFYMNNVYAYAAEAGAAIDITIRYEMGNPGGSGQWCVWNYDNAKMYQIADINDLKAGLAESIAAAKALEGKHEVALDAALEAALTAAEAAVAGSSVSEVKAAQATLIPAIAAVEASIAAYAKVKAAWEAVEAITAKYDELGNAAYNEVADPIKAAYEAGTLVTAECDAKVADINNALVAAAKATVQPQDGADLTSLIVNPSFENDFSGWVNNQLAVQSNESFGKTGKKYVEFWQPNGTKGIKQTLANLPQGYYGVTVDAKARGLQSAFVFANDDKENMTIADEQNAYTVNTIVVDGTSLTFGVEATGTGANASWIALDNFRLTYNRALTAEELEANRLANEEEIAAYNAAIEAVEGKLGFEAGEYAPYNNVDALTALAAAKVDAVKTKAVDIVAATTAIAAIELTAANEAEVNAIYDGTFGEHAYAENGNEQTIGWTGDANHDNATNVRHMYGVETNAGLAATSSQEAMFIKFGASYGKVAGYTMPLKANRSYTLTFKYGGWNEVGTKDLTVTTPSGETISLEPKTVTAKDNKAHTTPESWAEYTGEFTTAEAGNYVLNFVHKGNASSQNQLVFGDINIVNTSNEVLAQRDYDWWEGLCGELTAAMAGNEEYIRTETRYAIEVFMSQDYYPSLMQDVLEEANEAGTVYVCPFDKESLESDVRGWIAEIEGIKNGTIALYTETGVVGDYTLNSEMPYFATPVTTEVYVDKVVLKGWDGTEGSDLTIGYTKIAQNEEVTLSITGIEQTVNGEGVSETHDEGETPYVVLYPQSGAYSMIGIDVLNEDGMTGIKLGEGGGSVYFYGQFFPIPNIGGEDDNMGVEESIEAIYAVTWPGQEIINAVAWNRIKAQIANVEDAIANYDAIVSTMNYASRVEGEEFNAAVDAAREWVSTTTETYKAKYEAGTLTAEDGVKGDMMEQTMAVNDALNQAAMYDINRYVQSAVYYWWGDEDEIVGKKEYVESLIETMSGPGKSALEEQVALLDEALQSLLEDWEAYTLYSPEKHQELIDRAEGIKVSITDIVEQAEEAVGINNATVNVTSTGVVYNLAGQKVSSNYKGLVVKNGKTVIVK